MPTNMYPTIMTGTAILGVTGVKFTMMPPTVAAVRIATTGRNSWGDTSTFDSSALRELSTIRFHCAREVRDIEGQEDYEESQKC